MPNRRYILKTEIINSVEKVLGSSNLHDCLIEFDSITKIAKVTMDTTEAEHNALIALADSWENA